MSAFSATHWVIFAVIVAALLYGVVRAIAGAMKFRDWLSGREERRRAKKSTTT